MSKTTKQSFWSKLHFVRSHVKIKCKESENKAIAFMNGLSVQTVIVVSRILISELVIVFKSAADTTMSNYLVLSRSKESTKRRDK